MAAYSFAQGHVIVILAMLTALAAQLARGGSGRQRLMQEIHDSARLGPKVAQWAVRNDERLQTHPQLQPRPQPMAMAAQPPRETGPAMTPSQLRGAREQATQPRPSKAPALKGLEIAPGKFDYLFGRVSSNAHNAARSNQLALEMKRLGVPDTAVGRQMLTEHLTLSARAQGNVVRTFSNQYGNFEVRESLFIGPSGKAANIQSTFQILEDGTRRLSTVIPLH